MKEHVFRKILFDCHQATFLSVKREETSLTLREWIALQYHLFNCNLCRNFANQSRRINKALRDFHRNIETNPPFRLADEAKAAIHEKFKSL